MWAGQSISVELVPNHHHMASGASPYPAQCSFSCFSRCLVVILFVLISFGGNHHLPLFLSLSRERNMENGIGTTKVSFSYVYFHGLAIPLLEYCPSHYSSDILSVDLCHSPICTNIIIPYIGSFIISVLPIILPLNLFFLLLSQ